MAKASTSRATVRRTTKKASARAKKLSLDRAARNAVQSDRTYTPEFRARMVALMQAENGPSANKLSEETGVSQPTLSRWLRTASNPEGAARKKKKIENLEDYIPIVLIPREDLEKDPDLMALLEEAIGA